MNDRKKPHFAEYVDNTIAQRAFEKHLIQCVGVSRRFIFLCALLKWPFLKIRHSKVGRIILPIWILAHPAACWFIQSKFPKVEGLRLFDPVPVVYSVTTIALILLYVFRVWIEDHIKSGFWANVVIGAFYTYFTVETTFMGMLVYALFKPATEGAIAK